MSGGIRARKGPSRPVLGAVSAVLLALTLGAGPGVAAPAGADQAGERIYRQGRLPDGSALVGEREGSGRVEGPTAACVRCHRRSGLGAAEGAVVVPPIIGRYLFQSPTEIAADLAMPHVPDFQPRRPAYTEASLAAAIRDGIAADGRPLGYLMPRYALPDEALSALTAYLRTLHAEPAPGTDADTLYFATVTTPEADPVEAAAMLDVISHYVAAHNATLATAGRRSGGSGGPVYRVQRRWQLAVWNLTGTPDTWTRQLEAHYAARPVLALLSGIGGRHWAPVHGFCEATAVACLLPNVIVPVVAEGDFYPVYWSRGVFLEADLIATELARASAAGGRAAGRVVQVFRPATAGQDASEALATRLRALGLRSVAQTLRGPDARSSLAAATAGVRDDDVLVLWLDSADLAQLPRLPPTRTVFASGLIGGLERLALPAAWREATLVTFPVELPDARRNALSFVAGWLRLQQLEPLPGRTQADTYLACAILGEALEHAVDSYLADYLVERIELMAGTRRANGYYPRLGLGVGQRFASKGGYLVRVGGPNGPVTAEEPGWIVP